MILARPSTGRQTLICSCLVAGAILLAFSHHSPAATSTFLDQTRNAVSSHLGVDLYSNTAHLQGLSWQEYGKKQGIDWESKSGQVELLPADRQPRHGQHQEFYMSQARGLSLKPSEIFPYYYRATHNLSPRNVTITTMISSNRLPNFARLIEGYKGPISVVIHITNDTDTAGRAEFLEALHNLYATSPYMSEYVDAHIIIDNFSRQFNLWRNAARYFARSDYILMLDVDLHVGTDFRKSIFENPTIEAKLESGQAAFVIPPFEYSNNEEGFDPSTFPTDKEGLVDLWNEGRIRMFHNKFKPGQSPSKYEHYVTTNESYHVTEYQKRYEPYVVYKRDGDAYCDERFIGYGENKMACIYELYLSGVSFYVLPRDFLIHVNHGYPASTLAFEGHYNAGLYYGPFILELCHRYLFQFHQRGQLRDDVAKNMFRECKWYDSFKDMSSRLLAESAHKPHKPH